MPRLGFSCGPLDQHPLLVMGLAVVRRMDPQCAEARGERPGGAFAPADASELSSREASRQLEDRDRGVRGIANRSGARPAGLRGDTRHRRGRVGPPPYLGRASHPEHVLEAPSAQLIAPISLGAIGRIGENDAARYPAAMA